MSGRRDAVYGALFGAQSAHGSAQADSQQQGGLHAPGAPIDLALLTPAAPQHARLTVGARMEVAACEADHEGEWDGEWEECELLADHGETCDVRIVSDGEAGKG